MKNIHILPTDKPSRLVLDSINNNLFLTTTKSFPSDIMKFKNIYITSDEKIKEGDWFLENSAKLLKWKMTYSFPSEMNDVCKKIILTTDQDLIKDGVQAIDDEFLEWFVKNPNYEYVEIDDLTDYNYQPDYKFYGIIIPKEEPKQETLEEAAKNHINKFKYSNEGFIEGAKWQQERMYSEEEVHKILGSYSANKEVFSHKYTYDMWFEQLKKNKMEKETPEEAIAKGFIKTSKEIDYAEFDWTSFKLGAKWQAERMYSEEDILDVNNWYLETFLDDSLGLNGKDAEQKVKHLSGKGLTKEVLNYWFEQFKKK